MNLANMTRQTVLHGRHLELGARLGTFAGFDMPMWYSGIKEEHLAVRHKAGLFDLSHMGEIFIKGRQAFELVQSVTCNDIRRIGDGHCQYTLFATPSGGVVDDLIAYQVNPEEYMLVVNAANISKDYEWLESHNQFECEVIDESNEFSLVAVQGPRTDELLSAFGLKNTKRQQPFTFRKTKLKGHRIIVAATGYTGERGFEIITDNENAQWLWDGLMAAGKELGAVPVGLGARDTLRLEMGYSLYGHELGDEISVLEANLGWTVRFGPEFIGRDVLLEQKQGNLKRIVVGMCVERRLGTPRAGAIVEDEAGQIVGAVTSGSFSPSLNTGIALALVDLGCSEIGSQLVIDIRGKRALTTVCEVPFYKP